MDDGVLAAAVQLGALTSACTGGGCVRADERAVGEQLLGLLEAVVPSDASALQVVDPSDRRSPTRIVAARGLGAAARDGVAGEFLRDPDLGRVMRAPLPLTLSTDEGEGFSSGRFFRRHLAPLGFRDGMSAHLVDAAGATVAFAHFSARTARFGPQQQRAVAALAPALGRLVRGSLDRTRAAVVVEVDPAPGNRRRPTGSVVADDPRFARVLAATGREPGRRLDGWWRAGGWWRVRVEHLPAARGAGRLLVHAAAEELPCGLTARELDVLTCVAVGMANAQIAARLGISVRTVHTHVESLRWKTGNATRVHAASWAHREGVLHPSPALDEHDLRLLVRRA